MNKPEGPQALNQTRDIVHTSIYYSKESLVNAIKTNSESLYTQNKPGTVDLGDNNYILDNK